jgi:hypothetical protein
MGTNISTPMVERSGRQNLDWAKFDRTVEERLCCNSLFIVFAQHREEPKFCWLGEKLVVALKPGLLIRQFQMNVEILAGSPIFVEVKYIGIIVTNVKVVVNATGLGSRTINKTAQKFNQFCSFFWAGVQSSGEGATWFHNFLWSPLHHAVAVHAIWFFNLERESDSTGRGLQLRDPSGPGTKFLKGISRE